MKIQHQQQHPYGCALYAIANSCKDFDNFVTEKRLQESKKGITATELSIYLKEDGFDYTLEPIYYDVHAPELPMHIMDLKSVSADNTFLILYISVQKDKDSLQHFVAAYLDNKGNLEIFDSNHQYSFDTSFSDIYRHYDLVYGIYALFNKEKNNYTSITFSDIEPCS